MIAVSVIGGSGYGGGELLRILLQHPGVTVKQATSSRFAGQPISRIHPNLRGITNLRFSPLEELAPCDFLFVAIPNGASMLHMDKWKTLAPKIIDLGADFRLQSPALWKRWYGSTHAAPELIGSFIYGIPELFREQIRSADYVAGPGCEAIVSILTLYPLVRHGLIDPERIIIDAKMSSSQAGAEATASSHHPERSGVVRTYKPTGHRHTPEIEAALVHAATPRELCLSPKPRPANRSLSKPCVMITATAIEMVRGLLITAHTFPLQQLADTDVWRAYRTTYRNEPFIRFVCQKSGLYRFPEPKLLRGSNYCDIGFEVDTTAPRLVAIGAIDNLVKGTAGNAVQCMNLMCGFEEKTGLTFPGLHPV